MSKLKREIDKDLMYKKLMPSNLKALKSAVQETDFRAPEAPAAPPAAEAVREAHNPPAPAADREVVEVKPPFADDEPVKVVNLMEHIVLEKLDSVLEKFKCCTCDQCRRDIVALALNKLPPRYKVLAKGDPTPDPDPQTNAAVLTAIIQSILHVRTNPRH